MKDTEPRKCVLYSTFIGSIATFISFAHAKRWNLAIGVTDLYFITMTDLIFSSLATALTQLPCMALMIKIMPVGNEGTTFGLICAVM